MDANSLVSAIYKESAMTLKIQDSRGKDLFVVEDDAKEPKQVGEIEKKEEPSEEVEEEESDDE